ncbi:MAG: hypothetical protein V1765_02095 [bacterium]
MFVKKYTFWPFNLLLIFIACGLFLAMQSIIAAWDSPTCNPDSDPGSCNIPTPLNIGPDNQEKWGGLLLRSPLILQSDGSFQNLRFLNPDNISQGIDIYTPSLNGSYALTLPDSLPSDTDITPYYLTTDDFGQLRWDSLLDLNTQDTDWTYVGTSPNETAIYSNVLTRIGPDDININQLTDGGNNYQGDLYVQDELEVDGISYLSNVLINGATYDSAYVLNVSGDTHLGGNLTINGHILPGVGDTYNLGASDNRWSNVYAENINTTNLTVTNLNTNFLRGSVIFQGDGKLNENNSNLFWDDSSNSLGIGTDTPLGPLHVDSANTLSGTLSSLDGYAINGSGTNFTNEVKVGDSLALVDNFDNYIHRGQVTSITSAGSLLTENYQYDIEHQPDGAYGYDVIKKTVLENTDLQFKNFQNAYSVIYFGDETFIHNAGVAAADGSTKYTNTFVGLSAGQLPNHSYEMYNYQNNVGLGYRALANIDHAARNSAVGSEALASNITGQDNVAVGYRALFANMTASQNTAVGNLALRENEGQKNTAIGYSALLSNSSGYNNVGIGWEALKFNTSGVNNVGIGFGTGSANTTGANNVFIGKTAGSSNTTGSNNLSIGTSAGQQNNSLKNVFLGYYAGKNNNGGANVIIGANAENSQQETSDATAMPANYSENVLIGYLSGKQVGGTGNVMLGSKTGYSNANGSGNVFLGAKAGYDEAGSSTLYINNFTDTNAADKLSSLLYGEFYSPGVHDTPMLRVNGNVGISKMLEDYTPSSLLHLYQTSGYNPEIKIQATAKATGSSFQEHWGIYQDRASKELRFWNDRGDNYYTNQQTGTARPDLDNVLSLSLGANSPWSGRVGINTSNPQGTLEVHDGLNGLSSVSLTSYDDVALGSTSGTRGSASIDFKVGRVNPVNGIYQVYPSGSIFSSYMPLSGGSYPDQYANAAVAIRTVNDSGDLNGSTLIARHNQVGIAGDIDPNRTFMVHGATRSDDYHSGDDSQGATTKSCIAFLNPAGAPYHAWFCFKDGLFIDICADDGAICDCTFTTSSCN